MPITSLNSINWLVIIIEEDRVFYEGVCIQFNSQCLSTFRKYNLHQKCTNNFFAACSIQFPLPHLNFPARDLPILQFTCVRIKILYYPKTFKAVNVSLSRMK
jgi:hypothetical protein